MSHHKIFESLHLGKLELNNRIVMAPLTRCRANANDVPGELNAQYYAQRSSAGLIISEATQISPQGKGYIATPGIYSEQQIEGWKLVTTAVHAHQGKIFAQLWHVGRISHPDFQITHELPVAPSAIKPAGQLVTPTGLKDFVTPRALHLDEIPSIIEQYRHAAYAAQQAGFDGIELHAANGYLLDQFIRDHTNCRQDQYGGRIENRTRLLFEVIEAVTKIWDSQYVGIRISPVNTANDISDSHPEETFSYLVEHLNRFNLAYLHCIEGVTRSTENPDASFDYAALRRLFHGLYIANNNYNFSRACQAIDSKHADLIAFGRPFIANPDLVQRFRVNAPCAVSTQETWYGGGAAGYTDWPTLPI